MVSARRFGPVVLLCLLAAANVPAGGEELPVSSHFNLVKLADGVAAAIAVPGGTAVSNAGIVDLGGEMLVFDATFSLASAADLARAAQTIGTGPVRWLVNSHHHADHVWGNQAFPASTRVVSSAAARTALLSTPPECTEAGMKEATTRLTQLETLLAKAPEGREKRELANSVGYARGFLETCPTLALRPAEATFSETFMIHGTRRRAELRAVGHGLTPGDVILYLPDDGVVFSGDLILLGMHPYMSETTAADWRAGLAELARLKVNKVVPGHGDVGDATVIAVMQRYLDEVEAAARRAASGLDPAAEAKRAAVPAEFESWLYPGIFRINVSHVLDELRARRPSP